MDEDEAALAHVGQTVGDKYRLLSVLGTGGMGAVYEAEHLFTKRRVALKRMHQGIARSKHAAERFIRESQAPSTIGHPGIVQVLDGGVDSDGSLYLVLELLDGVSMSDAIEEHVLQTTAVTQIGIELLEALAAAHAKGFIHRDIKPDNVFLANDGRGGVTVKLLDFGIASMRGTEGDAKLTKTGSVLGTPLYMSPEQAQGARIDARSDLWSVGAVLYHALAGKAPYDGDTYNALIVSIVTQRHAPLSESRPDLPAELLDVVERALRKAPADRFDSAEHMSAALQALRFEANAQPSLPPLSSLRPTVDPAQQPAGARSGLRPLQRDASPRPAAPTRATGRARARVEPHAEARVGAEAAAGERARDAEPARALEGKPPRAPESVLERAVPAASVISERARRAWLSPLVLAAGLCLLAGFGISGLRGTAVPARAPTGQLLPRDPPAVAVAPASSNEQPSPADTQPAAQPAVEAATAAKLTPGTTSAEPVRPKSASPSEQAAAKALARREPQGLPPEALTRVLSQQQAAMQRCLEEAVVAQMLAGAAERGPFRLDIELRINPSGGVDGVEVQGQAPPDLSRCVRARLLAAQFPRAEAPTLFRYPLVLTPTIVGE